ncbi:MAG: hypothetical protein CK604_08815 [Curvibacter sp. PD_MW3]|nr:MAG: hypothetical protein CK604_08815 [Curvibacter sp. PD_MW3]
MNPIRTLTLACFAALTLVVHSQPAINSGADWRNDGAAGELPLRNLQIEVRQIDQNSSTRERLDATAAVRLQPGDSNATITLGAQNTQAGRSGNAQQQVLVLNGRRAAIVLRNTVALRLLQSFQRQGQWITVPGTVWLQAGTGFTATPRWDGGDAVELEISTLQGRNPLAAETASTSTAIVLPLGEWMTIAESEQSQDGQQSGLSSSARDASQSQLRVQVRVNVR